MGESKIIEFEINKLFVKGVIIFIIYELGEFIFIIFFRLKLDGIYCMIFNFKKFNELVVYWYFKMDILWIVVRMMKLNCYMVFIDIKDVYYFVFVVDSD